MNIAFVRPLVLAVLTSLIVLTGSCQSWASPFAYDSQLPLDIQTLSTQTQNDLIIQNLTYANPQGGRVPAYLIRPNGSGPFAGMILQHGLPGSREAMLDFAKDLALTGAVVLTIDAPFARPENQGREWPVTFTEQDRTEQIQLIIDLQRGVDLLTLQPEVDASRLAYVGYSYGAAMGGLLAGIERQIKAYGLMAGGGGLVAHYTNGSERSGGLEKLPKAEQDRWLELMEPIEPSRFIGHAAPAVLFFQNGRYDQVVSVADARAFQAAGSEPKRIQWYDSGHGLPPQASIDQVTWLAEQIGIDATKFNPS